MSHDAGSDEEEIAFEDLMRGYETEDGRVVMLSRDEVESVRPERSRTIEIEDFVPPLNPEGEVSKLTGMFHPANSTLTIARATASRVNAFGLQFDNTGKNGHSAPFSWAA